MDRIFISGLRVNAIIGCYPAERERRQGVTIDVELETDLAEAAPFSWPETWYSTSSLKKVSSGSAIR